MVLSTHVRKCRRMESAVRIRVYEVLSSTQRNSTRYIGGIMVANEWDHGLMDVAETASMLRVPVSWVYERTRRRGKERIPHLKLGKYLRFEITSVREWLNGQRAA